MIPKHNKLLHIESLRALSLILVLLYHYYPKVFPYGFLGVDIFFCISGFVISLAVNRTKSNFKDCVTFFAKRVNRLLPENQCIDGNSLYRDPVHLSKFGSKYLSEKY
jgi:peptidoglycan/LPS O-acetylase OafA/YrhL